MDVASGRFRDASREMRLSSFVGEKNYSDDWSGRIRRKQRSKRTNYLVTLSAPRYEIYEISKARWSFLKILWIISFGYKFKAEHSFLKFSPFQSRFQFQRILSTHRTNASRYPEIERSGPHFLDLKQTHRTKPIETSSSSLKPLKRRNRRIRSSNRTHAISRIRPLAACNLAGHRFDPARHLLSRCPPSLWFSCKVGRVFSTRE